MKAATLALVTLALTPLAARAAGTQIWEVRTAAAFAEGKLDGAIVTSRGEVLPGAGLERHEVKADAVWCVLGDPRGGVWLGTGSKGEIFRFDGAKDGKVERVAETGQTAVTVMRRDLEGNILAATIPEGRIFRIPKAGLAEGGKPAEWAKVPDAYVWDLAVADDGAVWAATGPEGKLYRIAGGEPELWYESKEKNLISLALGDGGEVHVGSGEKGFLYRVTEKGKARIVYDFDETEVRAIVPRAGGLLVAANAAKSKGGGAPPKPAPADAKPPEGAKAPAPPPSKEPMDCAVYRLSADGAIETAFASKGEFIWSLAPLADGSFVAATAERGRVYRARLPEAGAAREPLLLDGGADVLFDLEEGQALALGTEMGVLAYIGTGSGAALYGVDARGARESTYTSKAFDAKFVSTWGRVERDASGDIALELRSGATAEPDETWSDWRPADPAGAPAGVPRSRYAQFRAKLRGKGAALRAVRVAYLVDNQRPDVASVTAGAGGGAPANQKKPNGPPAQQPSGPPAHSTVVTVKWQAKDPDGDALVFRVLYRPEGEGDAAWREMTKEPVAGDTFAWETRGLPDGRYVVRVVASDDRANPEARSLAAARESDPVLVDHTPPAITDLRVAGGEVSGTARDAASRISHLAWSVDGGDWSLVAPADGLLDGPEEGFRFRLPADLAKGLHAVAVQAADEAGNLAAARERFEQR